MSWDVTIQRFSRRYDAVEEIPDDETCQPLGSRSEVQAAISRVFPDVDWSDPAWGICDAEWGSIEFNMGDSEPSTGFTLHVRASAAVVAMIVDLCVANDWQALDCTNGTFLETSPDPAVGLNASNRYRDQVVGDD
ncbi:MAG TPA: hypothetical protein VGD21_12625 [Lysobacter sp.]